MITSVFQKSKPINFIIVFFITVLAFVALLVKQPPQSITTLYVIKQFFVFATVYFTILVLHFIAIKNELVKSNNLEAVLFSFFLLLIPESLSSNPIIFANLFMLLAFRRLITIKSQKNVKTKLLDVGLLLGIAYLFYFWTILFLPFIPLALVFYSDNNLKHWIIPFLGFFIIIVLCIGASIIFNHNYFSYLNTNFAYSFNYDAYNNTPYLIATTTIFSLGIWASIYFLKNLRLQLRSIRPAYKIIFISLIVDFVFLLISPNKNGSEFLFLFAPLSIVMVNYLNTIKEKWFKELFLFLIISIPLAVLVLQFTAKS